MNKTLLGLGLSGLLLTGCADPTGKVINTQFYVPMNGEISIISPGGNIKLPLKEGEEAGRIELTYGAKTNLIKNFLFTGKAKEIEPLRKIEPGYTITLSHQDKKTSLMPLWEEDRSSFERKFIFNEESAIPISDVNYFFELTPEKHNIYRTKP